LESYQIKSIKISDKKYSLYVVPELCDEDLNIFEGFLFAEAENRSEVSYLKSRYRPPVSGYVPRIGLILYEGHLLIKDYRRNNHIIKTLKKINKTFLNKLKKALSEPKEENLIKLFDRKDIIDEFYILYKKARDYFLKNISGIPEEDKREEFVDNFMMQMLTLWYLQERGFFNADTNYFITKFKEMHQKKLFGGFKSYYDFLTYFFEKISNNTDNQYHEDEIVGKVVVVGPAVFLNGEYNKAVSILDKCFYKDGITDILIKTPPEKLSDEVPLLNLFESRDWTEGNIDEFVLGAIYEKLITYMERKKLGAYYTPEEITSYICKNTIEPYLIDRVNEEFKKNFGVIDQIVGSNDKGIILYLFEQLKDIKILDPAVGSAHFLESAINVLVGIYEKIWEKAKELRVEEGLSIIATDEKGGIKEINLLEISDENTFKLLVKFFIILSKNIYGVDINPSALKVAKARLFLTLAKHFEVGKDKDIFVRFPNVHFNLREGNSLIGYTRLEKGKEQEQLVLDLFVEEGDATHIVEQIKIVTELRDYFLETSKILGIDENIVVEVEDLNRILSKKEIKWDEFENVLRTKEKLIRILIASLNSQYARPLNGLLNKITELFNNKLDEKFAKEYNIDLAELNKIKTFHWIFEFPEVFLDRGGFDVVVGNPPYGFRNVLTAREKEIFRNNILVSFPSGDVAELFIKRALGTLTNPQRYFSFIVPKKSIYGESWYEVRALMRTYHSLFFVDAGKAFDVVKLEMIIFCVIKKKERNRLIKVGYFNKNENALQELGFMNDLNDSRESFYIYCININKDVYGLLNKFPRLSEFGIKIQIGQSNITKYMQEKKQNEEDKPILKGKDISRYKIRSLHYLPAEYMNSEYLQPKLVFQEIIAHIENPFPHIELMGILDKHGIFTIPDTSVSYTIENLSLETLLAILNSKIASWFYYNFTFNRAIRTMHFIDYYASQLPIPSDIYKVDSILCEIAKYLSFLYQIEVEESIPHIIDKQILDPLVYELYFKEKFHQDGLYPNSEDYLLELVSRYLKPIKYDRWAELYWKKQLGGKLTSDEEKDLRKLEKENLETIEEVYESIKNDQQIYNQIRVIKSHPWVKIIEEGV